MNKKTEAAAIRAIDKFVLDNLGSLVVDSVEEMFKYSDMTFSQKSAVVDGAIGFGGWVCNENELKKLRKLRENLFDQYYETETV